MFEPQDRSTPGEEEPGIREKLSEAISAAGDLLSTRVEIFGQEASKKAGHLARGLAGLAVALFLICLGILLFTALLVSLFTLLFGQLWAGILATLVLYGAGCAAAAAFGWKALTKVRPFEFPVTGAELARDWEAVTRAVQGEPDEIAMTEGAAPTGSLSRGPVVTSADDMEARFRAGSE